MPAMMAAAPYEIRTGGDGKSKKQSMAELKLRRLTELNQRLREDLERRRIPVSEAALEYVHCNRVAAMACVLTTTAANEPQSHCIHRQGTQRLDGAFSMGNSAYPIHLTSPHLHRADFTPRSTSARTPTPPSKVMAAAS